MESFEYAIKKDVRNNPIVREVDEARQRELWKSVGIAGFLVVVLLFSAWQHFELLRHGYQIEQMQRQRAAEEEIDRQLRLEIETLRRRSASRRWRRSSCTWSRRRATRRSSSSASCRPSRRHRRSSRAGNDARRSLRPATARSTGAPTLAPTRAAASRPCVPGAVGRRHRSAARLPAGVRARRSGRARRAPADADAAARRRSAATSSIAAATCSPPASTPTRSTPCRRKSTTRRTRRASCATRSRDCTARSARRSPIGCQRKRAFAYVRRQVSPEQAQRVADAESRRHRLHQGEPALLPEQGARGAPARLRRPRQQGPERRSSRPTTRRSAARPARS